MFLLCFLQINLPYIFTLVSSEYAGKIVLVLVVLGATGSSKQLYLFVFQIIKAINYFRLVNFCILDFFSLCVN